MARSAKDGRTISKQISLSMSMAQLEDPAAMLFATWAIPHCDDQGRTPADPMRLKYQVVPAVSAITTEDIERYLCLMEACGIIVRYQAADGTELLQYVNWWRFQDWQRFIYPSEYPPPPGWTDRLCYRRNGQTVEQEHQYHPQELPGDEVPHMQEDCRTMSDNVRQCPTVADVVGQCPTALSSLHTTTTTPLLSGEGECEGEGGCAAGEEFEPEDPRLAVVCQAYEQVGGLLLSPVVAGQITDTLSEHPNVAGEDIAAALLKYCPNASPPKPTPGVLEAICRLLEEYPADWFTEAVTQSAGRGACNLNYIGAKLGGWQADGKRAPPGREEQARDPPRWWESMGLTEEAFAAQYPEDYEQWLQKYGPSEK
ncbi:MAG: hypothetical protein JXA37_12980 [Chloroflexia bacterium]|nr:hypothetical protein [Chloroflexia bacterium]